MNEDGSMAKNEDLFNFAKKHKLKIGKIDDLIAYRLIKCLFCFLHAFSVVIFNS